MTCSCVSSKQTTVISTLSHSKNRLFHHPPVLNDNLGLKLIQQLFPQTLSLQVHNLLCGEPAVDIIEDRSHMWTQTRYFKSFFFLDILWMEICIYKYVWKYAKSTNGSQKLWPVSRQLTYHSTLGDATGIIWEDIIAGGPVTKVTCEVRGF